MKTTFMFDVSPSVSLDHPPQLPPRLLGRSVIPMGTVRGASVALACLAFTWTVLCGDSIAWSATFTWSSTATGTDWNVASNWGGTLPGSADIGLFSAASYSSQPSLTSAASIGGIWGTGSGAVTIGGTSALTLFGTTINSNTGTGIEVDPAPGRLPSTRRWYCRTTSNGSTIRPAHSRSAAPSAVLAT